MAESAISTRLSELIKVNPALRRLLFETSIDPVEVLDENLAFVYVSPGFERLVGRTAAELSGTTAYELVHPDDLERHDEAVKSIFRTGMGRMDAIRIRHADGRWLVIDVAAQTCEGPDGATLMVAFKHDITARVEAEERLRASEERYRGLVEGIEAVVWEAEPLSLTYTFVSRLAVDLLGYPLEEWYSPGFWEARLHPDDRERTTEAHLQAIERVEDHLLVYRMKSASGEDVWLRDMIVIVRGDDGKAELLRGVMMDVTAEIEAEVAHARLEADLRQAQKLDAIGRLAGGIAHDFNNLLTAIQGYAELALLEKGADPVRKELTEILGAAERAAGLTRQLLAFGRRQELRQEPIALNEVILEMGGMLQRLIGTHVELAIDLAPELRRTVADPSQMQQIVLNLTVNARDAMPEGGRLDLATENVERDGRPFVALSVGDTGVGMDAATRDRLFEPFFTTKDVGEGTGLGLATVYGIVGQSGGDIEVASDPGKGTTFRILLPAERDSDQAARS